MREWQDTLKRGADTSNSDHKNVRILASNGCTADLSRAFTGVWGLTCNKQIFFLSGS